MPKKGDMTAKKRVEGHTIKGGQDRHYKGEKIGVKRGPRQALKVCQVRQKRDQDSSQRGLRQAPKGGEDRPKERPQMWAKIG